MNRYTALVVLCASLLAFAACSAKKAPATDDVKASNDAQASSTAADPVAVAKELVTALSAGDTTKASSNFDATMLSAMPASKLSEVWTGVQTQFGAFKSQLAPRTEKVQGYDAVVVPCEFERGKLDVQVVLDGKGKVSGLFIRPAQG